MFYFSVFQCKKCFSIAWEKGTNLNCNAPSTVNKKGGGEKLLKQQIIQYNFLHVT